jgi:hypothetical protein
MSRLSWAGSMIGGENGMDLLKNICEMYKAGDHHFLVPAASIRNLEHLLYTFALVSLFTAGDKSQSSFQSIDS